MAERLTLTPEDQKALFTPESEQAVFNPERELETSKETDHSQEDMVQQAVAAETAQAEVAKEANEDDPIARLEAAEASEAEGARPTQVNTELKTITLRRELQQIRRKLPAGDRALSKVVHQPVVRAVSEAAGKSVTRPSGLLGGGLMAFVGSLSYLYLAKHVGFSYNYFVFTVLFAAGFLLGLLLEFIVWGATSRHRHLDV